MPSPKRPWYRRAGGRAKRFWRARYPAVLGWSATASLTFGSVHGPSTWQFWVFFLLGLALVGIQGLASDQAVKTARAAQEEFKVVLYDQLAPLARELSRMARKPIAQRRTMLDSTIGVCVSAASGLAGENTRSRATYFRRATRDGVDAFIPGPTIGRGDPPQSVFRRDPKSAEGMAVWQYAENDQARFVVDVQASPPPGWDPNRVRAYRTFITVPVRAGDSLVGLLTVNAVNPGDLSENDVTSMQVIASLIGTAHGMATNGS